MNPASQDVEPYIVGSFSIDLLYNIIYIEEIFYIVGSFSIDLLQNIIYIEEILFILPTLTSIHEPC